MKPSFPPSDHFDGQHFFNPGRSPSSRGLLPVLRWRLGAERAAWPTAVADPVFPAPPETVVPSNVSVTFVNHATFLLRFAGAVVLTDPIFSRRCSPVSWAGPARARPPGVALDDLPRPDVVLLSHNHYDHMDLPSLRTLRQRHAPAFVTMLGNARTLAKHRYQGNRTGLVERCRASRDCASPLPLPATSRPVRRSTATARCGAASCCAIRQGPGVVRGRFRRRPALGRYPGEARRPRRRPAADRRL